MFERYNENARRTIFFARDEASNAGCAAIESEHLLLGLVRESQNILDRYSTRKVSEAEIREALARFTVLREKPSTNTDLPLSQECKRILSYGAEEASRLSHKHIGTEHLMLGILREEYCVAARILRDLGVQLDKARTLLAASEQEPVPSGSAAMGAAIRGMGTGSLSPMLRSSAARIQIVNASDSALLLTHQYTHQIPRVNESILIRKPTGQSQHYKVQDVIWEFEERDDSSVLKEVKVRVIEEPSV
jgi:ATP-dependent Clp protease ATP-binding subunit ClpA